MAYFVFNGVHSWNDLGLICADMPYPPQAGQEYTYTNIPYRAIPLRQKNKYFNTKSITITVINNDKSCTDIIYSVLFGQGKLVLSTCSDRYFDVTVSPIVPQFAARTIDKIPLEFIAQPFAYSLTNEPVSLSQPDTVTLGGNIFAEPVIKVYGSGDGTLTVNGKNILLYEIDENIVLDTPRLLAYKGSQVLLDKTFGNLPTFDVGNNSVSWSGGITSVEITKNERWV